MTKRTLVAIALFGLVGSLLLVPEAFDPLHALGDAPLWGRVFQVAVGLSFIWGGVAALALRAERRTGWLMIACGVAWQITTPLFSIRVPIVWTLIAMLQVGFIVLTIYLLLSFPEGRLSSVWQRLVVWTMSALWALDAVFIVFYDPVAFGCADCQEGLNVFLIRNDFDLIDLKGQIIGDAGVVVISVLVFLMVRRYVKATKPARRVLGPMLVPGLGFALSLIIYNVFQFFANVTVYEVPPNLYTWFVSVVTGSLILLPIMFVVGLVRLRARRSAVGELVLELSDLPTAERLQAALVRALGDPSLEVAIWVPEAKRYLTTTGAELKLPVETSRVATMLERHGEPLGAIVHDPALLDDPGLVAAVTAAARLAVENEKLQEEVLNQLAEVHASRARLVETADAERRRIERNLHDGAQQRLVSLSLALRLAESKVADADPAIRESLVEAGRELEEALAELRELARGMYPAVLTDQGLGAAIESLATRAKLPVEIDLGGLPEQRAEPKVEATAYFVVSEALANAAKYSAASTVTIRASRNDAHLRIEVVDDGIGGASLSSGSGLRGLVDRVHALDGDISIKSPERGGTRIEVTLPCEQ